MARCLPVQSGFVTGVRHFRAEEEQNQALQVHDFLCESFVTNQNSRRFSLYSLWVRVSECVSEYYVLYVEMRQIIVVRLSVYWGSSSVFVMNLHSCSHSLHTLRDYLICFCCFFWLQVRQRVLLCLAIACSTWYFWFLILLKCLPSVYSVSRLNCFVEFLKLTTTMRLSGTLPQKYKLRNEEFFQDLSEFHRCYSSVPEE